MRRGIWFACTAALIFGSTACEIVDRVRNRGAAVETAANSASAGGLTLGLQTPGVLRPGEEGVIRLSLTNRSDTVPRGVRLDLLVPGWMEPMPPRPGDREVTMAALAEEGTRFSYRMDEPPVEPGQVQTVEQRIRVPLTHAVSGGAIPWSRVVRARLVTARGDPVAEVQSEISLSDTLPGNSARRASEEKQGEARDQLGPVRLGMAAAALRQAVPRARDTTWTAEGIPERGIVVPIDGGGRAIVLLAGDTVVRIMVPDSVPRTQEGLGVGSTLAQLRGAYGRACAGVGEGNLVVWFPGTPGISFALDARPESSGGQVRYDSEQGLPASARVTRWWLRRGADRCP